MADCLELFIFISGGMEFEETEVMDSNAIRGGRFPRGPKRDSWALVLGMLLGLGDPHPARAADPCLLAKPTAGDAEAGDPVETGSSFVFILTRKPLKPFGLTTLTEYPCDL